MIDAQREIELMVRSRLPFLVVHGADEERIEALLTRSARALELPLYVWTLTRGLLRAGSLRALQRGKTLDEALDAAVRMSSEALFLFKDLQRWLDDPATVRRLLDVGRHFAADRRTIILAGPDVDLATPEADLSEPEAELAAAQDDLAAPETDPAAPNTAPPEERR